jgi:hypothetical protein
MNIICPLLFGGGYAEEGSRVMVGVVNDGVFAPSEL